MKCPHEEGKKEALEEVEKIIDEWWGNQPKNITERTIEELKQKLKELKK
jgi:hypothetical protein